MSTLALSLDVPVVISPDRNFAILIGPFVDFGVSGTTISTKRCGAARRRHHTPRPSASRWHRGYY
jgi:hypothetical protein